MSLSPRSFKIGLYEEHLDELAFLRGQCVALRADINHGWQTPAPFEERLEAHLDALVVGDALALQTALAAAEGAEPDKVFAVAALCCRRADAPALQTLLQGVALDEPAQAEAVGHALLLEWPSAWQAAAVRGLAQGDPRLAPALAAAAACRGWPVGDALVQALRRRGGRHCWSRRAASKAKRLLLASCRAGSMRRRRLWPGPRCAPPCGSTTTSRGGVCSNSRVTTT
jgi:hypothetical protein